jgi:hypothetical protein
MTTKIVSLQDDYRKQYVGETEDIVVYDWGEPDNVIEGKSGYRYIYEPLKQKGRNKLDGETMFSFNNDDICISVRTERKKQTQKFSVGGTIFRIILGEIVLGVLIGLAATSQSE